MTFEKDKKMKTLKYKPDFARAQKYWDAFWAHEIIDRPCTIIWAKTRGVFI